MKKKHRFLKLKLLCCVWLLGITSAYAIATPQLVSVRFKNVTLHDVIWELEKQTTFDFVYNTAEVKAVKVNQLIADETDALEVLRRACSSSGLTFDVHDGIVIIKPGPVIETLPVETAQQGITIKGRVVDAAGEPVVAVSIMVEGTRLGTSTDINGEYTILAPANGKLTFSSIGYLSLTVNIGGRTVVNVNIEEDAQVLDDVIVIGYGVVAKGGSPIGAQASIKSTKLAIPVTSFDKALQGNASGVLSLSSSGQPGAGQQVTIRGMGTINAGTEPLYILDGVPIITGSYGNLGQTVGSVANGSHYSALAAINPNDIESLTILKDAAATSIYGARATNGVVLITTKRGQAGKTQFNVKISNGFSTRTTKNFTVMNKDEYLGYITEARLNAGYSSTTVNVNGKPVLKDIADFFRYRQSNQDFYDFDWQSYAFVDNAPTSNIDFTMSGGNEKTRFFLSFAFSDQKGTVIDTDFRRYSGRINLDHQINKRLKLTVGANMSYKVQRSPTDGSTFSAPVFASGLISPLDPGILSEGSLLYNQNTGAYDPLAPGPNPAGLVSISNSNNFLANSAYNWMQSRSPGAVINGSLQYTILDGLILKSVVGLNYSYENEYQWQDPRVRGNSTSLGVGQATHSIGEVFKWNETTTLNYIKTFSRHNINILLGQEMQGDHYWLAAASATNFPGTDFHYLSQGATGRPPTGTRNESTLASFFSSVNYNMNRKYHLSASLRADGSSRLSANNRWATFWSVGASWKITQEEFMKDITWINNMALRATYGTAGNSSGISSYEALGLYQGGSNYHDIPGIYPSRNANPALTWEKTATLDIGYEISVLNHRVSLSADWYKRTTTDLLLSVPLSYTSGFSTIRSNAGEMYNTGIELSLNTTPVRNNNFTWDFDINFTSNKNRIVKLTQNMMEDAYLYGRYYAEGYDASAWFLYRYAGVNPADGRPMYYDNDGEIMYTYNEKGDTKQYVGSGMPKFYGSISNRINFKNIDFSFMFFYSYGSKIYDRYWGSFVNAGQRTWWNQHSSVLTDRWMKEGDNSSYPIAMFGRANTSFGGMNDTSCLFDGSYVRLRDVTLGYTLPKSWTNFIHTTSVRLYAQATNLFTLTRFPDADPEVGGGSSAGYYYLGYPNARTITFGIDVKF